MDQVDFFFHLVLVEGFCVGFPETLVECFWADAEEESHVGCFVKFWGFWAVSVMAWVRRVSCVWEFWAQESWSSRRSKSNRAFIFLSLFGDGERRTEMSS